MGKTYGKDGKDFGSILSPSGKQPVDDRSVVDTKDDLKTVFGTASVNNAYVGMVVSVIAENALYQLKAADPTNLNNWTRIGQPTADNTVKVVTKSKTKTVTYNDVWFGSKSNS